MGKTEYFEKSNDQLAIVYRVPFPLGLFHAFQVRRPSKLIVGLQVMFSHQYVPNSQTPPSSNYPIGVGTFLGLRGPYSAEAEIPRYGDILVPCQVAQRQANPPPWIARSGANISGDADHYYDNSLNRQQTISVGGWYSIEGWSRAVTYAIDADGLVKLTVDGGDNGPPMPLTRMEGRIVPL